MVVLAFDKVSIVFEVSAAGVSIAVGETKDSADSGASVVLAAGDGLEWAETTELENAIEVADCCAEVLLSVVVGS